MENKPLKLTDDKERGALERIVLRLIRPEEQAQWDELVTQHHYLKSAQMVGERLCYVAELDGQPVALLGWSAPAYHLKGREDWIGWNQTQRRARLHLLAQNARFCLLTAPGQYPNLASWVLAQNCARLSDDWLQAYGHPILWVESFVDTQLFRGTCYKAAGWKALGCTAGFARVAEDFYVAHARPKQLYGRALCKHAERKLRARHLPAALQAYERTARVHCEVERDQLKGLRETLHALLPESRNRRGLRHRQASVLTITFAYLLSGGQGGHRAVALFADDLNQSQRAALGCWFNRRTRRYDAPSENAIYRVLRSVDVLAFQQGLWAWQKARHGAQDGGVVVLDGKALRGSLGTQLVGVMNAQSGRTLGVEPVARKSNEIPAGQTLLDRLDLDGTIALMDALHTQVERANGIVQEGGGDYVLIVKANQSGLLEQARHFLPEDFSPSVPGGGARPRAH